MSLYIISFRRDLLDIGLGIILGAGPGGFTDKENEFAVTERAVRLLDELNFPYEIVKFPRPYLLGNYRKEPVQLSLPFDGDLYDRRRTPEA